MALSMPLFVTPEDVILRMQLNPDLAGITDVITTGIIGAQLHVQRIIDGCLSRRHQDARYFIDAESFSAIAPNGAYRVEVPSGFIRKDAPLVISASSPGAGPFDDQFEADPDFIRVDYPRGYLHLDERSYGNCHLRIQCDTGFEDGTRALPPVGLDAYDNATAYVVGDLVAQGGVAYRCIAATTGNPPPNATYWATAVYPMEQLPMPIYEAIMSLVPMVFNNNQTTNRSDEAQKQYRVATDHAEMLLQPYVRVKGFTFRAA